MPRKVLLQNTGVCDFLLDALQASDIPALDYEKKSQNNLTATTDPTANDDADAGYEVLSRWVNTSSGEFFICIDATPDAAVWEQATLTLDELGSAALVDTGTGSSDVPQNSDLGTAAYEDITTSSTDTTAGRVTRVGDGGLLGDTPRPADYDSIPQACGFYWPASSTGGPNSTTNPVIRARLGGDSFLDIAGRRDEGLYWRGALGGTAGDWQELYHTGNLESANLDWTGDHTFASGLLSSSRINIQTATQSTCEVRLTNTSTNGETWVCQSRDDGDLVITGVASGSNELFIHFGGGFEFRDNTNSAAFDMDASGNCTFEKPPTVSQAGGGIIVKSPDGLTTKLIGIDNAGNLEVRDP